MKIIISCNVIIKKSIVREEIKLKIWVLSTWHGMTSHKKCLLKDRKMTSKRQKTYYRSFNFADFGTANKTITNKN